MTAWLSKEGYYYELERRLCETDICVPPRPSADHVYVNGDWILENKPGVQECPSVYCPLPMHPRYVAPPMLPPVQTQTQPPQPKETVLSENTKVVFGVRELIVVAAFIATAAISWNDTNSRIIKLEEDKVVLSEKQKKNEEHLAAAEKNAQNEHEKIKQSIRELEKFMFMKHNVNNKK